MKSLIGLSRRTISASDRPFLGDEAVVSFLQSGSADGYVRENLDRCCVLESEGRIVGYAVCQANLIDLMRIDLDFHRRGLGTERLRALERCPRTGAVY